MALGMARTLTIVSPCRVHAGALFHWSYKVASSPIHNLILPALYELQRPNEVIPFITGFYGDDCIPLSVVSLWYDIRHRLSRLNLQCVSLGVHQAGGGS